MTTPSRSSCAHLAEDRDVGLFVPEHVEHARRQLVLAVGARGIAHHAFFVGQLLVEEERVAPVECDFGLRSHLANHTLEENGAGRRLIRRAGFLARSFQEIPPGPFRRPVTSS